MLGKSFDSFGPTGPVLVTADEIPDPGNLAIRCRLNGQTMQDSCTDKLIFPVAELIAYVSSVATLKPGDLLFTGTPPGVGMAREPAVFLKPGDQVEVEVEGVGVLRQPGCRARLSGSGSPVLHASPPWLGFVVGPPEIGDLVGNRAAGIIFDRRVRQKSIHSICRGETRMQYHLPELTYAYDALEPHIDAATMEIHHGAHHKAYVDKLNAAIEGHDLGAPSVEELVAAIHTVPEEVRGAVRNHGGGHANHSLFWTIMSPNGGG